MVRFRRCRRVALRTPGGVRLVAAEARRPLPRLLGLALAPRPAADALLLPRCRSVHTWGMRFRLDVMLLAPAAGGSVMRVLAVRADVGPRRLVRLGAAARGGAPPAVLELPAGSL